MIRLLFLLCFTIQVGFSAIPDEVIKFDSNYYYYDNFIKDLSFEIRSKQAVINLKKNPALGKIKDVYLKGYWMPNKKLYLEIFGLPKGFSSIKNNLKRVVANKLSYVFRGKLESVVKPYKFTRESSKDIIFKGIDPTNRLNINRFNLFFMKDGSLNKIERIGANGTANIEFSMSKKPWTHGKWILDKVNILDIRPFIKVNSKLSISYINISNIGLPSKIDYKTKHSTKGFPSKIDYKNKDSAKELSKREVVIGNYSDIFTISNYKVNQEDARAFFKKINRKK